MSSTDARIESKFLAVFEKYDEFIATQNALLAIDTTVDSNPEQHATELSLLQKLENILDEYQEQSYLLDPLLEKLVTPVVEQVKRHALLSTSRNLCDSTKRAGHIASLLYHYIKFRGYKTIVRFFPHEVTDLTAALTYIRGVSDDQFQWQLRYVLLIWLYLVCMIPFDLSQFDESHETGRTISDLEEVGKRHLGKAGLEREGAALLLSRLYMRKDTTARFPAYLNWSSNILKEGRDVFLSMGALQVICEVIKTGPLTIIHQTLPEIIAVTLFIDEKPSLRGNTYLRKLKYKLSARVALRLLPPSSRPGGIQGKQLLDGLEIYTSSTNDDQHVPFEVEDILQKLFEGLQDKDTIVRYSAAKGVARIAERLSTAFAEQVLEMVMGLFSIHSTAVATLYDLPSLAESTWHGACLSCAEMARRGIVSNQQLSELVGWLLKALLFDLRKGAHSIGSNVRDAAAYVLWALARAQEPHALAEHATKLASRIAVVSLFDREVHVRRAASAAFQEFVGRTSLFPAGLDVLRKADFYAVSVRRNAFLLAAPQVAEHHEYQLPLLDHLLNVTIRHWDVAMRELASQSLYHILLLDMETLAPLVFSEAIKLSESADPNDVHGALLSLIELAKAYEVSHTGEEKEVRKNQILQMMSSLPDNVVLSHRHDILTAAACRLIAQTLTPNNSKLTSGVPRWRKVVEFGLKHRSTEVQQAASEAISSLSLLQDCSQDIERLSQELISSPMVVQQSLGKLLGSVRYDVHRHSLEYVLDTLLLCVTPANKFNIEARRNCYQAMAQILTTVKPCLKERIPAKVVRSIYSAMLTGLDNYTNDERGDVGSWIRMTCINGLSTISEILLLGIDPALGLNEYLPPELYRAAIAGILKQGLERLDNVRQMAGNCFIRLLKLSLPYPDGDRWQLPGRDLFESLLFSEPEPDNWGDSTWFFPKAVRFLELQAYRNNVLAGIVTSIGSKTDSTQRSMANSLVAYIQSLPVADSTSATFDVLVFIETLVAYTKPNVKDNSIFIPVLQMLNILLEHNAIQTLAQHPQGLRMLETILRIVSGNISKIKSISRVLESMKLVVHLLPVESLFITCVENLRSFFSHRVPRVRMDTAEFLYLKIQSSDIIVSDEVETILLETEWMSTDPHNTEGAFKELHELLLFVK
ncbi:hypothetical protein AMATHDRAFT_186665 [Amanita thiersii Skay4041]|uniref:Uncharacterized protein n=1 Tax=Amanita thiersii Skay4041 TaxID=703135 RepID=A0A2A9NTV4_9AGAR|nr:hypothetical protein AMATHDRAFT_186665 [Amanita thiersii Skay4041]